MTMSVIRMREYENEQIEIDFELEDRVSRKISPVLLLMKICEQLSNLTYIGGMVSKKTHCLEDVVAKIEEKYYRSFLLFFNGIQGRFSLSPIDNLKMDDYVPLDETNVQIFLCDSDKDSQEPAFMYAYTMEEFSLVREFIEEHEDDNIQIIVGDVTFSKEEFFEFTRPKMYPVYLCNSRAGYSGYALVAATSVKEANEFIQEFKKSDPHNNHDSFGYEDIDASDCMENLLSKESGIIYYGIRYY